MHFLMPPVTACGKGGISMFEDIKLVAIIFLLMAVLSSCSCKNSALYLIKEIGVNRRLYPRHYSPPAKWMRRLFRVRQTRIPAFLYVELILSVVFAIMGPVNLLISAVIFSLGYKREIIGILVITHCCLIIVNVFYLAISTLVFKRL